MQVAGFRTTGFSANPVIWTVCTSLMPTSNTCKVRPECSIMKHDNFSKKKNHEARYDYIRSTLPFAEIKMWVSLLGSHGSNYSASIIQRQEYCKSRKTQQAEDILLAGARTNDRMCVRVASSSRACQVKCGGIRH